MRSIEAASGTGHDDDDDPLETMIHWRRRCIGDVDPLEKKIVPEEGLLENDDLLEKTIYGAGKRSEQPRTNTT